MQLVLQVGYFVLYGTMDLHQYKEIGMEWSIDQHFDVLVSLSDTAKALALWVFRLLAMQIIEREIES